MKYQLFVYCRKNGRSCDDGLHAECEANSDTAAITELTKEGQYLLGNYDTVSPQDLEKVNDNTSCSAVTITI